jgi:beta-galactosidase
MRRLFAIAAFALMMPVPIFCAITGSPAPQKAAESDASPRSVTLLDDGWRIYALPDFTSWPAEAELSYGQIQQLKPPVPGQGWLPDHLPDDYIVRGTFSPEPNSSLLADGAVCPLGGRECGPPGAEPQQGHTGALNRPGRNNYGGHGYLPVYPAWYERDLNLPESDRDKNVWLDFGGVYRDAIVFINGKFVAQHPGGYTAFRLNITSEVRFGQPNTIAVFVDPRWFEGWWYEGGGIYRHVQLIVTGKLHITPWGTFVKARVHGAIHSGLPGGDHAAAQLNLETTVRNDEAGRRKFTLISQVVDPAGKVAASRSTAEELEPGVESTFTQRVALDDALLWSLGHRNLYRLRTTLRTHNAAGGELTTSFGIRTLRFDPDKGFFLNGKRVEIQGMCVHQDFPGVGIAAPDNLWSWRIEKLQAMGANAYRTSHGPVSDTFYDDADRMGMLVMAENRHLGDTYFPKASPETGYSDLSDVKSMVLRLRNHPSIIMWSLGNEEGEGKTPHGAQIFAAMKQAIDKIDSTRPITAAVNGGYDEHGFIPGEDILGMNYHNDEFAAVHARFPKLMIYGSEDVNAKSSRGTLETSQPRGLCSEYGCDTDLDSGPWRSWTPVAKDPFVAGEYVWTAFDYRGEPNPFSWPAVSSQTGAMDLAGFPKPDYYYWKAVWQRNPSVHISPAWTLPTDQIGKDVLVRVFSNCDRVELVLNGKSMGLRDVPEDHYLDWHLRYAPGTLAAVGYKAARVVVRDIERTAGAPAALRLTAEVGSLHASSEDVAPIAVAIVDAKGNIVPTAENEIQFFVSGDGTLAGVANGDPISHELNVAPQRKAFHGLAMVLVSAADHPGAISVRVQADGLPTASITIPVVVDPSSFAHHSQQ